MSKSVFPKKKVTAIFFYSLCLDSYEVSIFLYSYEITFAVGISDGIGIQVCATSFFVQFANKNFNFFSILFTMTGMKGPKTALCYHCRRYCYSTATLTSDFISYFKRHCTVTSTVLNSTVSLQNQPGKA